jgi:hypothetical protein
MHDGRGYAQESAILAAFALVSAGQALKPAVRVDPIDGVVEAFRTHQILMLPGGHGSRQGYELLLAIVREPRIQGTVTDRRRVRLVAVPGRD